MSFLTCTRAIAATAAAIIAAVLLGTGCANKVAPSGGPRDSIPAKIVIAEPPSGTTSFNADEIRFGFDDYVDRGIRNAITVLPTRRFSTSYAGDEISIAFREPLDSATTYSITIGTDWTDARGNRPQQAYTYVFSTGAAIDSGSINGRIVATSLQNVIVMCYPDADTLTPTFTPIGNKAPYIIPVGTSGDFSIKGLADGRYRVMACRDENKNMMMDINEEFVTAPSDVSVMRAQSPFLLLRISPAKDHEAPQIARVRALTNTLATVQFTEPVTPVVAWDSAMRIVAGAGKRIMPTVYWANPTSPDIIYMRFGAPVDSASYTLELTPQSVRDTAGMFNADTIAQRSLQWTNRQDTTQLRVMRITPADSSRSVAIDTVIQIYFSDAVDTNDVRISVWHQQPQGAVPITTRWRSPVILEITAAQSRIPKTWYTTTIVPERLISYRASALSTDSIVHTMLTNTRRPEPGTVKGKLLAFAKPPSGIRPIMRLLTAQGVVVATTLVDTSGAFVFESAPPGEYVADVFHDVNNNGMFDYGDYQPFAFSEPWWPIQSKVLVRSRWTLEDVTLEIMSR